MCIPPVAKLNIYVTDDVMLTSYFCVCKLWVLLLKTDIWWNVRTHQLMIVLTEPKNILVLRTIFYCELFLWFIFLAEYEIFNFVDVGRCRWPLACYQSNGSTLPVMLILLFKSFAPLIFVCLAIFQKHFAQACGFITLANSQTFLSNVGLQR